MANTFNVWKGATAVFETAGNWTQHTPAAADELIIPRDSAQAITGGDYDAYLLASFTVEYGYSQSIGTTAVPLQIQATAATINGTGPTYLSGTIATLTLANGTNIHIGYDNAGTTACALTTVSVESGSSRIVNSAITTLNLAGGTLNYGDPGRGTTAVATVNHYGGTLVYNSNATIGGYNAHAGVLDLSKDSRAVIITTLNLYGTFSVIDPNNRLTITNIIKMRGGTLSFT